MNLDILTPTGKSFSGEVWGVQLPGIDGSFEVLERHAPMVSALTAGQLKVLVNKKSNRYFQIESGFVEVLDNRVTVMVEGSRELENK
jgi:F-type H+-transporting ATPase subunit epsilon